MLPGQQEVTSQIPNCPLLAIFLTLTIYTDNIGREIMEYEWNNFFLYNHIVVYVQINDSQTLQNNDQQRDPWRMQLLVNEFPKKFQ